MHQSTRRALSVSPATTLALLLVIPAATIVSCDQTGDDAMDDPEWREVIAPLPSGVACSVEVTTPGEGQVFLPGPVGVTGFATVGEALPVATTSLVYVMDVSGSTGDFAACGGDPNGDGSANTVVDCEITALTLLHQQAITLGTVANVGLAVFGTFADTADMTPGPGAGLLIAPTADANGNGTLDAVEVLRSADSGGLLGLFTPRSVGSATSYGAGIDAAETIVGASAQASQVVVFVSDGLNNTAPSVATALAGLPASAVVHTFAVGADADCDVADNPALGTLRDIADATGGTCTNVPDASDLPSILPGVIMANLVGLELTLDGLPVVITSVTPPLPENGPATVNYSTTLPAPAPGLHTLCAEATCTDASGAVAPTECKHFRIDTPPEAKCTDVSVHADATCHASASVDDGSFDADIGDTITCSASPPGPYPLGPTEVTLTCTDSFGASSQCTGDVTVVDVTPPVVVATAGTIASLWPPNHQYQAFTVGDCVLEIDDNCAVLDPADATLVQRITSDEGELATGSGNTCDDAVIDDPPTSYSVRSERIGNGNGRVYHVEHVVSDPSGNHTSASCEIDVPHDQGNGSVAVDSGCALCVGSDCQGCSTGAAQCN